MRTIKSLYDAGVNKMLIEHIEIEGIKEDQRFVFSTDFEAIANEAFELSKGLDEEEGFRKFRAANIIMAALEVAPLAFAVEGLLWSRSESETTILLDKCRSLYREIYGSLDNEKLICLSAKDVSQEDWWKEAI